MLKFLCILLCNVQKSIVKIKQLQEKLNSLDPELEIYLKGYEGGVAELKMVAEVEVAKNYNVDWWYGPHEIVRYNGDLIVEEVDKYFKNIEKGVYLSAS